MSNLHCQYLPPSQKGQTDSWAFLETHLLAPLKGISQGKIERIIPEPLHFLFIVLVFITETALLFEPHVTKTNQCLFMKMSVLEAGKWFRCDIIPNVEFFKKITITND